MSRDGPFFCRDVRREDLCENLDHLSSTPPTSRDVSLLRKEPLSPAGDENGTSVADTPKAPGDAHHWILSRVGVQRIQGRVLAHHQGADPGGTVRNVECHRSREPSVVYPDPDTQGATRDPTTPRTVE